MKKENYPAIGMICCWLLLFYSGYIDNIISAGLTVLLMFLFVINYNIEKEKLQ